MGHLLIVSLLGVITRPGDAGTDTTNLDFNTLGKSGMYLHGSGFSNSNYTTGVIFSFVASSIKVQIEMTLTGDGIAMRTYYPNKWNNWTVIK